MKKPIKFGIERLLHNMPVFYYKRYGIHKDDYNYICIFIVNSGRLVKIPIKKIDRIYDV